MFWQLCKQIHCYLQGLRPQPPPCPRRPYLLVLLLGLAAFTLHFMPRMAATVRILMRRARHSPALLEEQTQILYLVEPCPPCGPQLESLAVLSPIDPWERSGAPSLPLVFTSPVIHMPRSFSSLRSLLGTHLLQKALPDCLHWKGSPPLII